MNMQESVPSVLGNDAISAGGLDLWVEVWLCDSF